MTPPRTILAYAPGPWGWPDFGGSPRYHLWTLAGMGWPVLYVEPPLKWRWKRGLWSAPDRPFHVLSPARVPPFSARHAPVNALGEKWRVYTSARLAGEARAALATLGLAPTVYWFGAPWHGALAADAPDGLTRVNFVYDELVESPAMDAPHRSRLARWESELRDQCGLVVCSSLPQVERRRDLGHPRVELLENAVRDDFLADSPATPRDPAFAEAVARIRAMPHPRVAYGGVADHRLDPAVFSEVLTMGEVGSLLFLGKRDPSLDGNLGGRCDQSGKAVFLGQIPYGWYPALYAECDALLIAHRRTPFTEAMYPEKLNEYLASGKPIVSVDLPEVRRVRAEAGWPEAIRVAGNPAEFAAALRTALRPEPAELPAERRRLAAKRTWSQMGERLAGLLDR